MPPFRRALGVAVLALVLCALAPAVASAATFQQRFSKNDSGDITLVANTLMTCPTGQTNASNLSCGAAKGATSGGAGLADNDFDMRYVDTDGDPSTFDSSGPPATCRRAPPSCSPGCTGERARARARMGPPPGAPPPRTR